jgi:predicted small secreted protein
MMQSINRAVPRLSRLLTTLLLLGLVGAALSACNTMSGAGKDVTAAGTAVSGAADDTKAKLPSP